MRGPPNADKARPRRKQGEEGKSEKMPLPCIVHVLAVHTLYFCIIHKVGVISADSPDKLLPGSHLVMVVTFEPAKEGEEDSANTVKVTVDGEEVASVPLSNAPEVTEEGGIVKAKITATDGADLRFFGFLPKGQ